MDYPERRRIIGAGFSRRAFLRSVLLSFAASPLLKWTPAEAGQRKGVIVDRSEFEAIRKRLRLPEMAHVRKALMNFDTEKALHFLRNEAKYERRIWDIPTICVHMRRAAFVTAIEGQERALDVVVEAMKTLRSWPNWDYFQDGEETIGLQRAPQSATDLVFTLELVGDRLPDALREEILADLAEKGCMPCYRTLWGFDSPDFVKGWHFAPDAEVNLTEIDMTRWPRFLPATNLHAVPTSGLGIGALYLLGKDPRAEAWLNLAMAHARDFCARTIREDGAYIENVSYWSYAISNLLLFLRGLERVTGTDLYDISDFQRQVEFAIAMQAGRRPATEDQYNRLIVKDGLMPDIVNFSDSFGSFHQETAAMVAAKFRDSLAQKAALERAGSWSVFTPVVYDPGVKPAQAWPAHLLRRKFSNDWVVWRTGWGDDDVVIGFRSGGPANHEHADRNSVVLKAFGEWLLRDPIRAAYDRTDEKWHLRLTEAHNCILIDGQGHGYLDGTEGTNSSQAHAVIRRYVDRPEVMMLSSDATQAYRLVNTHLLRVVRTLVWVPPEFVLIFDKVVANKPVQVEARFLPENGDGKAVLEPKGDGFALARPKAILIAAVDGNVGLHCTEGKLPVHQVEHPYRYVAVQSDRASDVSLVTAALVGHTAAPPSAPRVLKTADGFEVTWQGDGREKRCRVHDVGELPEIEVSL